MNHHGEDYKIDMDKELSNEDIKRWVYDKYSEDLEQMSDADRIKFFEDGD